MRIKNFSPVLLLVRKLKASSDLSQMARMDAILMVAPAQFVRAVSEQLAKIINAPIPIVICAKGIETKTGKLMGEVLAESLPGAIPAILSGPSFASDVACGLPTAVTLATNDKNLGENLAKAFAHKAFRPYWSDDLIGVQIGGAVKNVLAIATGIVMGKKLGPSAHASLTTRGFAELTRFAESYGAKQETLMGLSGLGDLILTCSSPQSRNMSLGIALGEGRSLDDILSQRTSVSEGVYTASAVIKTAHERGIDMPIATAVEAIVTGKVTVDEAIDTLLSRPLKAEN